MSVIKVNRSSISVGNVEVNVFESKLAMGDAAATAGADDIRQAIVERGEANIIVATGASQFEMLRSLVQQADLPWNLVTAFHLDEYVGLPITHPASFRLFLWSRFVSQLPLPLRHFHYINVENDLDAECNRLGRLIETCPIDVAFIGIGENGHLAFNDPPADFDTQAPYLVVNLDEKCRRQQLSEGWFPTLEAVPDRAITMSIDRIMRSKRIICTVPDARKADAVGNALNGPMTNDVPASKLQLHEGVSMFLDRHAARDVTVSANRY
jgi:glucosamine-6-phosphate deaminase